MNITYRCEGAIFAEKYKTGILDVMEGIEWAKQSDTVPNDDKF